MKRISNWESAFSEYIESKRNTPYEYGTNDCCMFAAGSVEAITGEDPMSEFRGKYKSLATSVRALQEIGAGDLESTMDGKFPVTPISLAQRGDLAFFDKAIGVVMGSSAWFVSDDGLERIPRSMWDKCWSVAHE